MFKTAVSPRFATYLHVYLLGINEDPERIFEIAGIEFNRNQEYNRPLRSEDVARLYETAASELGDPLLGLNMGRNFSYESAGLATLLLASAADVQAGLNALMNFDKYVDNALDHQLIREPGSILHAYRMITAEPVQARHFIEYIAMMLYQNLLTASRREFHPIAVSFMHEQVLPVRDYAVYFGTKDIRFGAERNTVEYPNQILAIPFVTANKLLHTMIQNSLQTYASAQGDAEFADIVSRELMRIAVREIPSIEVIASNLSISSRTLRRKLLEEGYTFQKVKQMALEKRSKYLLEETNLGLAEVAYELGYSEVSAFSRAFRSWTGETPQKFREGRSCGKK